MKLEKMCISGLNNIYLISSVKKEFVKITTETWNESPPWREYQKRLLGDLAVLESEKEKAVKLKHFEKLSGYDSLYCIRHPESSKNERIIYTFYEGNVVLLKAFQEKTDGDYKKAIATALERLKWLNS